ncbi:MAG: [Victivallales bacterium]|nr:[FeFe] hydrogenase H-cluster radical SAM maturase HydE [Victivallales bacterium]
MNKLIAKALAGPGRLAHDELVALLRDAPQEELFAAAYELKCRYVGRKVALRGLIEWSNICGKNCYYCGIRSGNPSVHRYRLSEDEVLECARWTCEQRYGSLVLQGGEVESEEHTVFIEGLLRKIHAFAGEELGVTLSLGEQSEETYRRWLAAGAHRYLLRIESSSPEFYAQLHPASHSFNRRLECLRTLKRLGYQMGSGVMIGLPGQTYDHLAGDLEFFRREDCDMIGMGPYIPHAQTPLGKGIELTPQYKARQLELGLRMIAVCRLYLHNVNIASTTALQALREDGRELGFLAGANVAMPNVTGQKYRPDYELYPNKPCTAESAALCCACFDSRVKAIGEEIAWGRRNDPPHFQADAHNP